MSQQITLTTENAALAIAENQNISAYEGLFTSVNYYTGIDNALKAAPCVIVYATDATPEPPECPDLGNWTLKCHIIVKERAATVNRETTTLADTIYRGFLTGSIEKDLANATSSYFVHHAFVDNMSNTTEGKMWVE